MRNPPNYTSPAAKAVLARMLELLAAGPADTPALIAASGKSSCRGRDYIRHLAGSGRILCVARPGFIPGGGSISSMWALDPTFVEPLPDAACATDDEFPRRVIVRSSWAPNHVRDSLHCLLFGVPAALQGAAA